MSSPHTVLLSAARDLLHRADPATAGIWPRATALLTRAALEEALDALWRRRAPALERCSARAQLLCLPVCLSQDEQLAGEIGAAWSALSRACHYHSYELPPTASELMAWIDVVHRLHVKLNFMPPANTRSLTQ